MANAEGVISFHKECDLSDDHGVYYLLTEAGNRQKILDDLEGLAQMSSKFRVNILPVDTTIPATKFKGASDSREELRAKMTSGARLDFNYLLLTFLSTLVALIGLLQDNIAVVIGAMVIAPFLGPNLAFAFATSLGEKTLMIDAFKTGTAGVVFAIFIAAVFGVYWAGVPESEELLLRTRVGLDGVALAAAAGVAGVLSLTSGLSMTLVGVMVAVAILPPAVTVGFMLGAGEWKLAYGAIVLLSVNIVCVNLAGLLVFLGKGIAPRVWFERKMAKPYVYGGVLIWAVLLILLLIIIRSFEFGQFQL
jgi:uncharacterized hydrophobic protein (TIGR00341 family)